MVILLIPVYCLLFQLKTAREAAQFGLVGAAVGAITTAGYTWKWSRSPHGMLWFRFIWSFHIEMISLLLQHVVSWYGNIACN